MLQKLYTALFFIFFFALFFLSPKPSAAQGSCVAVSATCVVRTNNCESGYTPELTRDNAGYCYGCSCVTKQASSLGVTCPENEVYIGSFDACLSFTKTITWGITAALIVGALLAGIRLGIGILGLAFSTGDSARLGNARDTITDAVLGLVLIASAWILFNYLNDTFPARWQIDFFSIPYPQN